MKKFWVVFFSFCIVFAAQAQTNTIAIMAESDSVQEVLTPMRFKNENDFVLAESTLNTYMADPVSDKGKLLNGATVYNLNDVLRKVPEEILVVTFSPQLLDGKEPSQFATEFLAAYNRDNHTNAILFYMTKTHVGIETDGKHPHIEKRENDILMSVIPYLQRGLYDQGMMIGVAEILKTTYNKTPSAQKKTSSGNAFDSFKPLLNFFIVIGVIFWIGRAKAKRKSAALNDQSKQSARPYTPRTAPKKRTYKPQGTAGIDRRDTIKGDAGIDRRSGWFW